MSEKKFDYSTKGITKWFFNDLRIRNAFLFWFILLTGIAFMFTIIGGILSVITSIWWTILNWEEYKRRVRYSINPISEKLKHRKYQQYLKKQK